MDGEGCCQPLLTLSLLSLRVEAWTVYSTGYQQSESGAWSCVAEKLETFLEGNSASWCSSPKGIKEFMLQILRLYFHLDFRQCHLVDHLTVHIFHHWLVARRALTEPKLLDPSEPQ